MSNYRKRNRPRDPPKVAIANANKSLSEGRKESAFNILQEAVSYVKRASFDQTHEEAMKMYIDVGCDILKSTKEGFLHYRSLVQQLRKYYILFI